MSGSTITLDLEPRRGAGSLLLGMPRADARDALSALGFEISASKEGLDYACENSVQLEFDAHGRLRFIGFACHRRLAPRYHGIDVFSISAKELFQLVSKGEGGVSHVYNRGGYLFPVQIISLWEAARDYDCRTAQVREVWGQVGLGNEQYLFAVRNSSS